MEIFIELSLLAAVLHCLLLQMWMVRCLRGEKTAAVPTERPMTEAELEAGRLAAEAQAKYEQGFINIMSYDGMPAAKKEGVYR